MLLKITVTALTSCKIYNVAPFAAYKIFLAVWECKADWESETKLGRKKLTSQQNERRLLKAGGWIVRSKIFVAPDSKRRVYKVNKNKLKTPPPLVAASVSKRK